MLRLERFRHHHFAPTPVPAHDMDAQAVAFHEKATAAVREILFQDAERTTAKL